MESNVCQNGCHKYIKTMYDVIKALAKHKNAALHMKEVIKIHEKETIKVQRPYNFHAKSK